MITSAAELLPSESLEVIIAEFDFQLTLSLSRFTRPPDYRLEAAMAITTRKRSRAPAAGGVQKKAVKKPRTDSVALSVASPVDNCIAKLNEAVALFKSDNNDDALLNIDHVLDLLKTIPKCDTLCLTVTKQYRDVEMQTDPEMNINMMPFDCMYVILKNFPLQHIIQLRGVCSHWKDVIEQICNIKRSLKLFGTYEELKFFAQHESKYFVEYDNKAIDTSDMDHLKLNKVGRDDDLIINGRHFDTEDVCKFLVRLFPNISTLLVFFKNRNKSGFDNLPFLLLEWSRTLTKLSLFGARTKIRRGFFGNPFPQNMCFAINNLPNLKWLDLQATGVVALNKLKLKAVLKKLQYLSCSPDLYSSLCYLSGDCTNLTISSIWRNGISVYTQLEKALTENSSIITSITRLRLNNIDSKLPSFVSDFTSLSFLSLKFSSYELNSGLIQLLNQLPNLTELAITNLSIRSIIYDNVKLGSSDRIGQVKSLYLVNLEYYRKDETFNGELFARTLARVFPSLESLTILYHYVSYKCSPKEELEKYKSFFPHLCKLKVSEYYCSYHEEVKRMGRHMERYKPRSHRYRNW